MAVDRTIIEDCKSGKRRAQNALYNLFSGAMLGVCMRYATNLEEAEDLLQEGFIKVFANIRNLKDPESIGGWIRRIMVNTAINHCHKKKIRFDELHDDRVHVEEKEEVYQPVEPETLMRLIQQLPEGYKMVLNLYVFEGFSHREIAGHLRISENTSKTQLFKARKTLRKMLEKEHRINQNLVEDETRI